MENAVAADAQMEQAVCEFECAVGEGETERWRERGAYGEERPPS